MTLADLPGYVPPPFPAGSVWLVGAGPGDPGLLTLHALWGLGNADVVVHDALVDPRVLALIPEGVLRENLGKRGGEASSPKQTQITARLIELAGRGSKVLRLKGGDPFLFGRGADEALALAAAGIPFRVVPGITAGIGGLAYAGIPATAGTANAAVAFVTGHDPDGGVPNSFDWDGLARGAPVIVVYMPMRHLDDITARLMAGGRAANEAAAIVSRAATPEQRVVTATLGTIDQAARIADIAAPALLVVGEVVNLRRTLDWFTPSA